MAEPVRVSLDASGLNATIRDTLVSSSSIKIPPFTGEEDPNEWISNFEMMTNAADWDDEMKSKKFPMYLREGAACWYRSNYLNQGVFNWLDIKTRFLEHYCPANYNIYLQEKISTQRQRYGEGVVSYVDRMTDLCARVVPPLKEDQVIEKIVQGLDPRLAQMLSLFDFTSVSQLLRKAKKVETALKTGALAEKAPVNMISSGNNVDLVKEINQLKSMMVSANKNRNSVGTNKNFGFTRRPPKCYNCDRIGHVANECRSRKQNQEPRQKKCNYCKKTGHLENDCFQKKRNINQNRNATQNKFRENRQNPENIRQMACLTEEPEPLTEALNVMLNKPKSYAGGLIIQKVLINNKPFECIVDTGPQLTIISRATLKN